jgi:hypothetical protein
MKRSLISFEEVSFAYGEKLILDKLTFTIEEGSFVSIIGRSGSGKTTLLKLIAGVLQPTNGRIIVNGCSLNYFNQKQWRDYRLNMGYVFQQGALFTDLTVKENVAFMLHEYTQLSKEEIDSIVDEQLEQVGLAHSGDIMPTELSGGMIKRVALARAIVLRPRLLLYDEPFSGLDPITLKKIAELISTVQQQIQTTSLMVTHEIRQSLRISNQVILLEDKRIIFCGAPHEIHGCDIPAVMEFLEAAQ